MPLLAASQPSLGSSAVPQIADKMKGRKIFVDAIAVEQQDASAHLAAVDVLLQHARPAACSCLMGGA